VADWADDDAMTEEAAPERRRSRRSRLLQSKRGRVIKAHKATRGAAVSEDSAPWLAGLDNPFNVFAMKVNARDGTLAWANPVGRGEGM